ncbi:L,D-transpeptidase family protein [Lagierella sp.]|uniref:L,D-transpeptidase family protein n=1 Tax=Lagierella sp. TaxID=2849657 RepID=UPI00262C7A12|nr:L,D-transpeptidase family protein [Lagierella sp.]
MNKKKKIAIPAIIFLFIFITYFGGVYFFSRYTYPKTTINGQNIAFKPVNEIFESSRYEDLIILDKDDVSYRIQPENLGFKSEWEKEIILDQKEYLWPIQIFTDHNYENKLIREVNKENLMKWLNDTELIKGQVEPQDATLSFKDHKYELIKEVEGKKLDISKLVDSIEKAYLNFDNQIVLREEYIKPQIYEEDLKDKLIALNKLADKKIVLVMSDGVETTLDDYEKFIDEKSFVVSKDKVKDYVIELKNKYDNLRSERDFKTFSGDNIKVSGGNFGIQINRDKTTEAIYNTLTTESENKVPIVYTSKSINNGVIGNTYIEISLASQRMIFYKNGEVVVDTPVVTGLPNGRYNTPRGVWEVWIKNKDRYLQGKNADGSDYKSWVNYWMQIDYTGVGIHDAYWQSSFGGNRYKYAGSHGCINTPYKAMKLIYDNADMGIPVVVY